jgi:hypothetical protein
LGRFFISGGKRVLVGGCAGLITGGIIDFINSDQKHLDTSSILNTVIFENTLKKCDDSHK